MVKIKDLGILISISIFIAGCANRQEKVIKEEPINIVSYPSNSMERDERKVYYKGDYDINYKEPRTVWFKPLLTENGNIISERTITLSPKDLKWSNENNIQVGEKFKELTKDRR